MPPGEKSESFDALDVRSLEQSYWPKKLFSEGIMRIAIIGSSPLYWCENVLLYNWKIQIRVYIDLLEPL